MSLIITLLEIIICFVVQTSVIPYFSLANISPNLLLILVVSLAHMKGRNTGLLVGFFTGLLVDLTFSNYIGLYSILYMFIGYLAGYSNLIYADDDFALPIVFIAVGELFYNLIYYIASFLLRGRLNILFYMRRIIIPSVIYTVVLSVIAYKLLHTINFALENRLQEGV